MAPLANFDVSAVRSYRGTFKRELRFSKLHVLGTASLVIKETFAAGTTKLVKIGQEPRARG